MKREQAGIAAGPVHGHWAKEAAPRDKEAKDSAICLPSPRDGRKPFVPTYSVALAATSSIVAFCLGSFGDGDVWDGVRAGDDCNFLLSC